MTKQIICEKCFARRGPMHPEDVAAGWKERILRNKFKKPKVHQVRFYVGETVDALKLKETEDVPSLLCDLCGDRIPDRAGAVAITMWRPDREEEPDCWEKNYL